MDSSAPVYGTTTQTQQDHLYRYRYVLTADLAAEEEYLRYQAAQILIELEQDQASWEFPQASLDYVLVALRDVQIELARRKRLSVHPIAPVWPQRNEERYQRVKNLATRLKSVVTLEKYCQHELGMTLRPVGKNLIGHCVFPDHEDRHPNFSVSPSKQLWTCTCRKGGDLFVLVPQLHGIDRFPDQVIHVAEVAGVTEEVPHAR